MRLARIFLFLLFVSRRVILFLARLILILASCILVGGRVLRFRIRLFVILMSLGILFLRCCISKLIRHRISVLELFVLMVWSILVRTRTLVGCLIFWRFFPGAVQGIGL